jgi:hypothetical protein
MVKAWNCTVFCHCLPSTNPVIQGKVGLLLMVTICMNELEPATAIRHDHVHLPPLGNLISQKKQQAVVGLFPPWKNTPEHAHLPQLKLLDSSVDSTQMARLEQQPYVSITPFFSHKTIRGSSTGCNQHTLSCNKGRKKPTIFFWRPGLYREAQCCFPPPTSKAAF